jgi:hypothetical protein
MQVPQQPPTEHKDVQTIREAWASCRLPQPIDETAEEVERARPFRELLGVTDAGNELAAALLGREWLTEVADAIEPL